MSQRKDYKSTPEQVEDQLKQKKKSDPANTPAPTPAATPRASSNKLSEADVARRLREEHLIAAASAPPSTPMHRNAPKVGQKGSVFTFAAAQMFQQKRDKSPGPSNRSHTTKPPKVGSKK